MTDPYEKDWELADADEIEYRAFHRTFELDGSARIWVVASCAYRAGDWDVRLVEKDSTNYVFEQMGSPVITVISFESASLLSSPLTLDPTAILVTDAHGTHKVEVLQ